MLEALKSVMFAIEATIVEGKDSGFKLSSRPGVFE